MAILAGTSTAAHRSNRSAPRMAPVKTLSISCTKAASPHRGVNSGATFSAVPKFSSRCAASKGEKIANRAAARVPPHTATARAARIAAMAPARCRAPRSADTCFVAATPAPSDTSWLIPSSVNVNIHTPKSSRPSTRRNHGVRASCTSGLMPCSATAQAPRPGVGPYPRVDCRRRQLGTA